MAVALLTLGGCTGATVMPTTYDTYDAKDGSFLIEYPAGWEVTSGGSLGYAWAKFTSGSAQVTVDTNLVGSLMADIAKSHIAIVTMEGRQDAPPVEKVHESEKSDFAQESGATEQTPAIVTTRLGESCKSEFTGTGALGDTFHGYRVTALSRDKRIRIICQCSEAQWQSLQPAFDKMIVSVAIGTGSF
jgi:hypothetical protein